RARPGRPRSRRQGLHDEPRVHQPDPPERHVREVAHRRSRGDPSLLRAQAPRRWHDQGDPAEDPRPGHRLAVSARAEEGAEGVIARRELLKSLALPGAGIAALLRPAGAEPPLDTTKLRLARITDLCVAAPQQVAEDLLRGEGFTDIDYV